jgi:hypothetical protein
LLAVADYWRDLLLASEFEEEVVAVVS